MKKILIFIAAIIFSGQLFAQEETILDMHEVTHGGFGGPVVKFTQINNEFGLLVGGRGGWIINHTFVIGGGGYGLANNINGNQLVSGKVPLINFGYGGFEMEYIYDSDNLIHFTAYTLIGGGSVNYRDPANHDKFDNNEDMQTFFILEPAVSVELNVVKFFRINFGASYRYISNFEYKGLNQSDVAGPSAILTFKFGKF